MRSQKILKGCVLALILSLLTLSKPISLDSYPSVLFSPGGGVPPGLAQGPQEENVIFVGDTVDEPSGVVEGTEVLEKRTLTSKTYQAGSNVYRVVISTLPMHYVDEAGNWQDIETAIEPQDDGSYYSGANIVKARFPGQLGAGQAIEIEIPLSQPVGPSGARIEPIPSLGSTDVTDSQDVSVTWQPSKLAYSTGSGLGAQQVSSARVAGSSATVSDNVIVYGNAFPGVAEEFTLMPGGVKHSLVLFHLPDFVPGNPPPDSFLDYEVEMSLLPGISLYVDGVERQSDFSTSSTIELRRGEKEIVGYLLAPYAYERDNPRKQVACTLFVHFEPGRIMVTVRTPMSWLAAPDRVYPVVIDPTTSAYLWQDTFMSETHANASFWNWPTMYAGYDPPWRLNYGRERALMYWSVESIPYSSIITSASIWLYQTESAGLINPCTLGFFRLLNSWYSAYATWNYRDYGIPWNSPGASGFGSDYYGTGYGFDFYNTNNIWKVSTVAGFADWVQGWINGTYPNYGVMLKDVSSDDCDRGFLTMNYDEFYAPYLEVDYTFTGGSPILLQDNIAQTHTYPNPEHYYVEDSTSHTAFWRGTALRPLGQSDYDLWLHTASDFSEWWAASRYGVGQVDYILTKKFVTTTAYPRVVRYGGIDNYNIAYMHRVAQLNPPYSGEWIMDADELWEVFEIYLSSPGSWQVVVTPLSGNPDLGVAIHDPTMGDYHTRGSALALSDQIGQNLTERIEFTASSAGYYGLVVWSNIRTGVPQQFLLEVKAPFQKSYLPVILRNYVPPQGSFSNGGFENDSRWILSGELQHERTTAKRHSGSYSLQLGHDGSGPCLGKVPCSPGGSQNCESTASAVQGFDVPSSGSPSLSFYYQIYTYDHKPTERPAADYFAVYVQDLGTSAETLVYKDDLGWVSNYQCYNLSKKDTWQYISSIDLSAYKGKTVQLIFKVTNGGHNYWNTWVYVDDVTCNGC